MTIQLRIKIDLTNIISNNKIYYRSSKNDNNFVWKDYNLLIEIINVIYVDEHAKPKNFE